MREMVDLAAELRTKTGKGGAYQTRRQGKIPGIVYGGRGDPENVQVDERTFGKIYYAGAMMQTLVMLDVAGKKTRVLPRAVQLDPVSDRPIHVDFMRLEPGARIRIAIPVRFRGQENSPGLKLGGVINVVTHEIEVYCSADNIPDYIEGDLDGLEIGDSLHINDFTLPAGVKTVIQGRNFTVASISPPTTYVEETPVAAAAEATTAEGVPVEGAEGAAAAPGATPGAAAGAAPGATPGAAAPTAGAAPAAAPAKGKAPEKGKK
jgi:large subunit ribosomal protein L25